MANPLFSNIKTRESVYENTESASYKGVTFKTLFLLLVAVLVAFLVVYYLPQILVNNPAGFYITLAFSSILGFISVIVGRRSYRLSKYFSFVYAVCEGLFLGTLTAILESQYPGVSIMAIFSTFIIFFVMLILFGTGVIRVNNKFRALVMAFTLGAVALVFFSFIMSMFIDFTAYLGIMIVIELFLLIYGAITLALNFAEAQYIIGCGCDKEAEWSVALGLTVSLIYIYIQAIRLFARIRRR